MTLPTINALQKKERSRLLSIERTCRNSGNWGTWTTEDMLPGTVGLSGWLPYITRSHRNRVFAVLERQAEGGVIHLAVSSLSGIRPTWPEMQRIKDEISGPEATAIEVYPPKSEIIDEADMFHIWVLRGKLPFGLHKRDPLPVVV